MGGAKEPGSPNGERAEGSGAGASNSSGLGGLGLEGMVGMEPVAEGMLPPGEGNNGAISGESSWKGEMGCGELVVKSDGEAEIMVEDFGLCRESADGKASKVEAMKAIMSAEQYQKEAILMMMKSVGLSLESVIYS